MAGRLPGGLPGVDRDDRAVDEGCGVEGEEDIDCGHMVGLGEALLVEFDDAGRPDAVGRGDCGHR